MDDTNDHGVDTDLINLGDRVQVGGTWDDQPGWGTVILIEGLHEEFYVRMDDPDFRGANSHVYSYLGDYTVAYFAEHSDIETHKARNVLSKKRMRSSSTNLPTSKRPRTNSSEASEEPDDQRSARIHHRSPRSGE